MSPTARLASTALWGLKKGLTHQEKTVQQYPSHQAQQGRQAVMECSYDISGQVHGNLRLRASKGKKHFTRLDNKLDSRQRSRYVGNLTRKHQESHPVVLLCGLKCLVHHESKDVVLLGTPRMHEGISDSPVISGALLLFSGYSSVTLNTL